MDQIKGIVACIHDIFGNFLAFWRCVILGVCILVTVKDGIIVRQWFLRIC
jgi:hypothetical protein